MTFEESIKVIHAFIMLQPAYKDWQNRHAHSIAGEGGDAAKVWGEMKSSIARTLSRVDSDEAMTVIARMESGKTPIPPYGELALTILREAKILRQPAQNTYDTSRSVSCRQCMDRGIVNVWNPNFVEDYRIGFDSVSRTEAPRETGKQHSAVGLKKVTLDLNKYDPDGLITAWNYFPPDWECQARRWWAQIQQGNGGPIHHVALCNCSCPRKVRLETELADYLAGTRTSEKGNKVGLPACGRVRFDPKVMMLKTPDSFADLSDWYANHAVNEIHAWQP